VGRWGGGGRLRKGNIALPPLIYTSVGWLLKKQQLVIGQLINPVTNNLPGGY